MMSLNSAGYGFLFGMIAILGIAAFISSRKANKYQNEAEKAETEVKVQAKKEEDDADPIDKAISDFDSELDSDNKPKGG